MAIARASLSISSAMLSPCVAMELSRSLLCSALVRGRQRRRGQRDELYFIREGLLARLIQERGQRRRAIAGDEPALEVVQQHRDAHALLHERLFEPQLARLLPDLDLGLP